MADGFDDVYVDTRRQLRGVAESLIAGPQRRALTSRIADFFERARLELSK
jgi:hypothetical protein